ncbi:DUF1294 domain-containing protein [bacterium]|nr:DUF1294 domain-containing protein [bacterium]MBU1995047.1 DUF1294 domain-containing protein [bacterium]
MQKIILIYFIFINVSSFILYTFDKFKARVGGARISENLLHLFSALGGFLGSTLSMWIFRHKTKKVSFLIKHILILGMWITAIIIYFTQINELNFLR